MSRQITKGTTNVSVVVRIIDSSDGTPETGVVWNTAGIDLWYRREGAAVVSITEATLAALTTVHTDGGFLTISHGYYRLDVPDAAFASGVNGVMIGGTVTGMIVIGTYVELTNVDLYDGVRGGMTALPNAAANAAGGLPISAGGGLALDTKLANTNEITAARMGALTDWINAGRLDTILDTIATDSARLTAVRAAVLTDWINGGRLDLLLDAIPTTAMRGTDSAALASVATEGRLAELDAANLPADIDAIPTTAMRGTDGANTTVPDAAGVAPTAIENRQEMDSNSTQLSTIAGDVVNLDGDSMVGTDNAALASGLATHDIDVKALLPATLVGGRIDADVGAKTGNVALSTQEKTDVNAEVVDVITVDTHAEVGQATPPATATILQMLQYPFKWLRNKKDNNGTTVQLYDDSGATVDQKRTVSEAAGTVTEAEIETGP